MIANHFTYNQKGFTMSFMRDLNEIQADEMINEFKRFMHFLTPKDKDIFLKKLMEEIEEAKKRDFEEQIEAPSEQNTKEQQQTDEFITDMQQTIIEESQNITKDSPQEIKEEANQPTQTQEAQELSQEANTDTIEQNHQPLEQTQNLSFEDKIQNALENFTIKHQDELLEMGILKIDKEQEGVGIYNNDFLLDQQELQILKNDYDNAPNKEQWQPNAVFDIDKIRQKHQDSQNFIDGFMSEVKEVNKEIPSLSDEKKLNPNTYFTDLIDWFEKKKIENLDMPISKEDFKQEFFEYCKNGMSENEMKILLILQNKEPSTLSKEHKDMINQGLKYNLQNNKLLDKGLEFAIMASVGEKISNENANEFVKSTLKMEKSSNLIDKRMNEGTNQKIAKQIKENSPNLWQETNKKLNAIIDNKTQALQKTTNATLKIGL